MVRAIREIVTVGANGTIRMKSPELQEGVQAEVIVLLDQAPNGSAQGSLAALDALQESLRLNAAQAREWAERNDAERKASSRL